jgi:hypothetical protein
MTYSKSIKDSLTDMEKSELKKGANVPANATRYDIADVKAIRA